MSEIHDAIAKVSARNNYHARARELQKEADEIADPVEARRVRYFASIARKAAEAEAKQEVPGA